MLSVSVATSVSIANTNGMTTDLCSIGVYEIVLTFDRIAARLSLNEFFSTNGNVNFDCAIWIVFLSSTQLIGQRGLCSYSSVF